MVIDDGIQLGEGSTPKEIHDPDRSPTPAKRWTKVGIFAVSLLVLAFLFPFAGSRYGHYVATDKFVSSGYSMGCGGSMVFARAGQKLHLDYQAKVQSGSLVIHVWPTGMPASSVRTIRLEQNADARIEIAFPKTGLYRIEVDTFRSGGSYDVDYEISWYVW